MAHKKLGTLSRWRDIERRIVILDAVVSAVVLIWIIFTIRDIMNLYALMQIPHTFMWLVGINSAGTFDRSMSYVASALSFFVFALDTASVGVRISAFVSCSSVSLRDSCDSHYVKNIFLLFFIIVLALCDLAQVKAQRKITESIKKISRNNDIDPESQYYNDTNKGQQEKIPKKPQTNPDSPILRV